MLNTHIEKLARDRFTLWVPPKGAMVLAGAERQPVPLPEHPLPLHKGDLADGPPSDAAIGQGVYDYLRQFPDCDGNKVYAELLRDAYPHFITDLASHAVMLDAKQIESTYVLRKLTCLKILCLLDPRNYGLLLQLARGYFELALDFVELANCRQHLREAMRFGQELLALAPTDPSALSLLAEIDYLLGDYPAAVIKWQRLAAHVDDPAVRERIAARIAACPTGECPETALADDLEAIAEAMRLHALGDNTRATSILERLEEAGRLTSMLPSADFYWLLGICRQGCGDAGGAVRALHAALELEPGHPAAQAALAAL
ncbi:MAG: hypothetical protein NDI73_01105 [Desulfuromonadales bacterium]|nr:hypothetical protein [Desulfuromonadales bacterium]